MRSSDMDGASLPWFGMKIPDELLSLPVVGARAVHRHDDPVGCDFVADRWSYRGQYNDLLNWVNARGCDLVRHRAGDRGTGDNPLQLDDGCYHVRFVVRSGYVYCLFWKDQSSEN